MRSTTEHKKQGILVQDIRKVRKSARALTSVTCPDLRDCAKQLRSMSHSKSTGLDGIGVSTLKLAAPAIAYSITYICNLSIKTKSFPEKWKELKVTPIVRKGKTDDCSNHRPISVLPILSIFFSKNTCIRLPPGQQATAWYTVWVS